MNKLFPSLGFKQSSLLFCCIFLLSCSTEKDSWVNRTFHQTTARYNGYYNAGVKLDEGLDALDRAYQDDFTEILPVLKTGDEKSAQSLYSYMDEVILKCSNVIQFHSMEIRRKERNKWIDENYLLIGKARFYKQEYASALQAFDFVARNFPKENGAKEAKVWIARTQLKRGNLNTAMGELEFLRAEKELPRKVKAELFSSLAWVHIELGNYVDAIDMLTKALAYTRKKDKKIRYTFILAQLNQKIEEYEIASGLYKRVIRYNPPYEFTFHSKLNRAKCFDVYSGSPEQIVKQLQKMIKDDKNIEYLDQVYYTLADVYLRNGSTMAAIDNLKLSVKYSIGNQEQLGLSYFTLAQLLFDQQRYVPAQMYYDSASRALPMDHPEYAQTVIKRNSLQDLVTYTQTIEREDSLQNLAVKSESERNRIIDNLIRELERKEQEEKELQEQGVFAQQNNQGNRPNSGSSGSGDWYFYNPSAMSVGFSDFQRKWGRRTLEDNWRRKNKQSQVNFDEEEAVVENTNAGPAEMDPKKRDFYLQNLPLTKEKMKASDKKIQEAYYKLGLIYKDKLKDYRAAIKSFLQLLEKYPDTDYELRAWYNLYQLYETTGYRSEMELYEAKIFKKYPKSDLANLMRDPEYFSKKEPKNAEADMFYRTAYEQFTSGQAEAALIAARRGLVMYKDNAIAPKLALLEALALGKTEGPESMKPRLKEIVTEYAGHEVSNKAQELLNMLGKLALQLEQAEKQDSTVSESGLDTGTEPVKDSTIETGNIAQADPTEGETGNEPETVEQTEEPIPSYYKEGLSGDFMYVLIVPVEGTDVNIFKNRLSDFNQANFAVEDLIVRNFQMGKEYQLITVRGFTNAQSGLRYFKATLNDINLAEVYGTTDFNHFVISQTNFGTFYGKRDISGYKRFFEARLLPLQSDN